MSHNFLISHRTRFKSTKELVKLVCQFKCSWRCYKQYNSENLNKTTLKKRAVPDLLQVGCSSNHGISILKFSNSKKNPDPLSYG